MDGILRVEPEKLQATASDFQGKGSTVSSLTNEMMNLVTNLSGLWEGDAATAYINKFRGLQDDIEKMIRMINEHVDDLNQMAEQYKTAEQKNVELANTLSSDVIV